MTGNVNVPLYMNPTSTPQQQQALQMMRAQLMAQQFQQSGQMPADNEMAGNVVVRHSPLEYLSRQVSQNMGNTQQLKAAQMQMQLMGQNMGGSGAAGGAGSGTGIDPSQLRKAAMYDVMYGAGSGKAYLDSIQPTPEMKTAGSVGMNALDYNNQNAQNTAKANAGMKTTTYTTPEGKTMQTTEAALADMAGGGQKQPSDNSGSYVKPAILPPMLPSANQSQQGSITPAMQGIAANSGQIPNGAAVPPVQPVQGGPMPPPDGFAQANGSIPPQANAMAPMAGFKDPSQASAAAPQSIAPQQAAQNTPPVPFSQMVQNSAPSMGGGMQIQSPAQAEAQKASLLAPINANATGMTEAQKNYQTYRQGLNTTTSNLGKEVGIANAQDDFKKLFQPGAGETQLAQAAAAAASAGASPTLQQMIARGDPGAVQAFDALASQESVRQMEGMMAGNGNSNPRITQAMFDNFKEDLSNPNKQSNAIDAIHNMMRLQYKTTYDEQQAALADKGDPTTFQERYQAMKYPALMSGRGADPSAAIQNGSVQSQIPPSGAQQVGTKGGKPVYKLPDGRGWMPD